MNALCHRLSFAATTLPVTDYDDNDDEYSVVAVVDDTQ